jgi:hypothetical protein
MTRRLKKLSEAGPLLLGPVPGFAMQRLRTFRDDLQILEALSDTPSTWPLEKRAAVLAVTRFVEAFLRNGNSLAGLLPDFRMIVAFSRTEEPNASASSITSLLGTPLQDEARAPAFLIVLDLELVSQVYDEAQAVAAGLTPADVAAIIGTGAAADLAAYAHQVAWLALMLAFFHELFHAVRGHLGGTPLPATWLPADLTQTLIYELDADLHGNVALKLLVASSISVEPGDAGVALRLRFLLTALAARSLFGALARSGGTALSPTHPAKAARVYWCVRDLAAHLQPDDARDAIVAAFFAHVDCRLGMAPEAVAVEQVRQHGAWQVWQRANAEGYFARYFPAP